MSNWEIKRLDDIAKIERGRFSPRPRNDPRYYGGNIPFVQTGDVSRAGTAIQEYSQTLNEEGLSVSKLFPKKTILMTIAANVGDVAILDFDSACPDSLVAFTPKEGVSNKWLFHVLSTMKIKFDSLSTQNAQKNLSLEKIKPVKIQVPPYDAQEDMASTFDNWDTAIEKTEALIDAKERQFGWLKSSLITRQCSEHKWNRVKLSAVANVTTGQPAPQDDDVFSNTGLPFVRVSSLDGILSGTYSDEIKRVQESVGQALKLKPLGKGTLVFAKSGMSALLPRICKLQEKSFMVSHLCAINPKEKLDVDFLLYYLSIFHPKRLIQGDGFPSIKTSEVAASTIHLPPLQEQKRIANTLNTAQEEIKLLKKLADQYRTQKRGLMQKLLSGEWHIKNKEAA